MDKKETIKEIAALTEKLCTQHGLRIMQLLGNAIPQDILERYNNDLYYLPDAELLEFLTAYDRN